VGWGGVGWGGPKAYGSLPHCLSVEEGLGNCKITLCTTATAMGQTLQLVRAGEAGIPNKGTRPISEASPPNAAQPKSAPAGQRTQLPSQQRALTQREGLRVVPLQRNQARAGGYQSPARIAGLQSAALAAARLLLLLMDRQTTPPGAPPLLPVEWRLQRVSTHIKGMRTLSFCSEGASTLTD